MPTKSEKQSFAEKPTTGHEWDGITEYDNPLPKWWLWILWATIAWSLVYYVLYPSIPGITGYFKGVLGYSSRVEVAERMAEARKGQARFLDRIAATPAERVIAEADLRNFAVAGGRAAFADNCSPCHGAGGAGRPGFPVLADDVWIWGGKPAEIEQTVRFGVRSGHDKTRQGMMPAFGADRTLKPNEIDEVAEFVLALTNRGTDKAAAERGTKLYAQHCASCHGDKGEGKQEFGGPPLNTRVWLYGGAKADLVKQMNRPQHGVMPAFEGRLDAATIRMLAVYVHTLGGGK